MKLETKIIPFPNSPTQKSGKNFLSRLRATVKSQYGLDIDHQHRYQISESLQDDLEFMSVHLHNDQLFLPIHCLGHLAGTLTIDNIDSLDIKAKSKLIEFLRVTAIPYFEHLHRLEGLNTQQKEVQWQLGDSALLPLKKSRQTDTKDSWDWKKETIDTRPVPLLIRGKNQTDIKRAALDLHQFSPRSIFIDFNDIDLQFRSDARSLAEFSGTTILISELSKLSPKERAPIFSYLQENPSFKDGPALYLGTTIEIETLSKVLKFTSQEKELLPRFQLDLVKLPSWPSENQLLRSFVQHLPLNIRV